MLDINFLNCVASNLFKKECEYEITEKLKEEAKQQSVYLMLFPNELERVFNSVNIECAHNAIHRLMTKEKIPYVILKGCASGRYYDQPILRTYGDVDFYISRKDFEKADKLLTENGYQKEDTKDTKHWNYIRNNIEIEMHHRVNGIPDGEDGKKVEKYMKDLLETAIEIQTDSGAMMVPDDFHHGLIILLHKARHMTSSGMGVRHLCDWAVFVNKTSDKFQEIFEECLKDIGMWKFAQIMTAVCTKYLGLPKQDWVGEFPEEFLEALMEDIMDSGNFGRKKDTNYEVVIMANINEGGKIGRNSALTELFKSFNSISYKICPLSKKIKIILPFIWFFIVFRYLFRVITGRRKKVKISTTVSNAGKRRDLYQQLEIFEK